MSILWRPLCPSFIHFYTFENLLWKCSTCNYSPVSAYPPDAVDCIKREIFHSGEKSARDLLETLFSPMPRPSLRLFYSPDAFLPSAIVFSSYCISHDTTNSPQNLLPGDSLIFLPFVSSRPHVQCASSGTIIMTQYLQNRFSGGEKCRKDTIHSSHRVVPFNQPFLLRSIRYKESLPVNLLNFVKLNGPPSRRYQPPV